MNSYTICYVWQDLDSPNPEQKFGDHYVHSAANLDEAFEQTRNYVRSTLGRQKHKYDQGRVVIHELWDVTDYARLIGAFGPNKKVDDKIRPCIGHHIQADVHGIDADTLIIRVNQELNRHRVPRPMVGLSQNQYDAAVNVLTSIERGARTVIAELCARFGKTIWSGVLVSETNTDLTIIASYVLTSFTSFKKDFSKFEQFKNFVLVDSQDPDYEQSVTQALADKKQVVVFLSMCAGSKRQQRIDWLFSLPANRLVFIDEADFGSHQQKQARPLIQALGQQDVVVLMTGTNADRAASYWGERGNLHYISVTYPELLIEKRLSNSQ